MPGTTFPIPVFAPFHIVLAKMLTSLTDVFVFHYYHPLIGYYIVTTKSIRGEELTKNFFSGNLIAS